MSAASVALGVGLYWLSVHAICRYAWPRLAAFPLFSRTRQWRRRHPGFSWLDPDYTTVNITSMTLRIETAAFNSHHSHAASWLSGRKWKARGLLLYDAGILVGVVGVVGSMLVLAWTAFVLARQSVSPETSSPSVTKRSLDGLSISVFVRRALVDSVPAPSSDSFALRPLIPGVTVPLSHLPLMLAALFLCQSFHELGHALSAAFDSIPLASVGLAMHVVLPTAFVSLNYPPSLSSRAQLRVGCAGAWHNILLWLGVCAVSKSGLGSLARSIGWTDVSGLGKVVLRFHEGTDLGSHIPLGSLITRLDDTPLGIDWPGRGLGGHDPWDEFLLAKPKEREHARGWCIDNNWFSAQATECCHDSPTPSPLVCFVPVAAPISDSGGHCLPPSSIFNNKAHNTTRCTTHRSDCLDDQTCILPAPEAQLLRITFIDMQRGKETVILWRGPRREVWRQVQVGTVLSRADWIPLWLPEWIALFTNYNLTITLGLYVLNLLPLPYLDGGQVLSALLDVVLVEERGQQLDSEALTAQPGRGGLWKHRIERAVHLKTAVLAGIVAVVLLWKEFYSR